MEQEFNTTISNISSSSIYQQPLVIRDWQREHDERNQQIISQVIVCANLMLVLVLLGCLFVARWMSASGCIKKETSNQIEKAVSLAISQDDVDFGLEMRNITRMENENTDRVGVPSLKRMKSWQAVAAEKIERC